MFSGLSGRASLCVAPTDSGVAPSAIALALASLIFITAPICSLRHAGSRTLSARLRCEPPAAQRSDPVCM